MRRVVHLSDLHFGRERPELLDPLVEAVKEIAPDVTVISGDLTQRARKSQFRAAARLIERLSGSVLAVPGNHDVPLDHLPLRLARPWRRYRRFISKDMEPIFEDDEIVVAGINTANPWVWQSGLFGPRQRARLRHVFGGDRAGRVHILAVHHPLEHRPAHYRKATRGTRRATELLSELGTDVVLSGHLHNWRAEPFARADGHAALQVHAGTGLSTRQRGEENDFNLLEVEPDRIRVERWAADAPEDGFTPVRSASFTRGHGGWRPALSEEKLAG